MLNWIKVENLLSVAKVATLHRKVIVNLNTTHTKIRNAGAEYTNGASGWLVRTETETFPCP